MTQNTSTTPDEAPEVDIDEIGGIEDNSIPGTDEPILFDDANRPSKFHDRDASILTEAQVRALVAPLNGKRVKQLDGNSYLQAWDVKAALVKVFGFGGFSADVIESSIVAVREYAAGTAGHVYTSGQKEGQAKTPQVIAKATLRLTIYGIGPRGEDVTYTETAVGANSGWDIGKVMDNALKTAESAALKRCATYLGTQFGLSLYNNGTLTDVVQKVLSPWQGKVIDEKRAEREQQEAGRVAAQLGRATAR